MNPEEREKLRNLQKQLQGTSGPQYDQLQVQRCPMASLNFSPQEDFDDLVAAECRFCGDIMIQEIEEPFVEPNEEAIKSWYV